MKKLFLLLFGALLGSCDSQPGFDGRYLDSHGKIIMTLKDDGTGDYQGKPVAWGLDENNKTVINLSIGDGANGKFTFLKGSRTLITLDEDDKTGEIVPVVLGTKE